MPVSEERRLSARIRLVLYAVFALSGAVTTLLGPLIPIFAKSCSLSDADAGILIAAQFAGNFTGSLFANRNLGRSVRIGVSLIALGVGGLAFSACAFRALCAACYGAGLGLTITAINLIIASEQPSRRASSLSMLNFIWGAGAVSSPLLLGWALREQILPFVLMAIAAAATILWLLTVAGDLSLVSARDADPHSTWYSPGLVFFAILLFLYIGVETSVGNWAAPYALRMRPTSELICVSSVACFWLALLAGRLACAFLLRRTPETLVFGVAVLFTIAGFFLLLTATSGHQVLAASSITGLGLAPLFPLLLSFASGALLACRNSGWVFSIAALGGAVVPWITGQISTGFHSLRAGLIAPAGAMLLIIILSAAGSKERFLSMSSIRKSPAASL